MRHPIMFDTDLVLLQTRPRNEATADVAQKNYCPKPQRFANVRGEVDEEHGHPRTKY